MARPKEIQKPRRMSFLDEQSFYDHLQRQASIMSLHEKRIVSLTETIKRGLRKSYPLPHQEMFKY